MLKNISLYDLIKMTMNQNETKNFIEARILQKMKEEPSGKRLSNSNEKPPKGKQLEL